jgi:hypothetical protein
LKNPAPSHRVENVGDNLYNAVYVGIKTKNDAASQTAVPVPDEEAREVAASAVRAAGRKE